jgi:outer membrane protein assembly factor BamA
MLPSYERKASAAERSPGFFNFVVGCLAFLSLAVTQSSAQVSKTVHSISVRGNSSFESATIEAWMETKPGATFRQSDIERIVAGYAEAGFPFGGVDSVAYHPSEDSASFDVVLYVHDGKPSKIASLEFVGLKVLDEETLRAAMQTRVGERFLPRLLESDIGHMLSLYESKGFPFARIEVRDVRFVEAPDEVNTEVLLGINEGSLARLRDLRVGGNTTTSTNVIARAARVTAGDVILGDEPSKIKRRLERLQLFSSVAMPEPSLNEDGSVNLSVKVVEGNPNSFDGIIGYVPAGSSGSGGYVTGLVDVQFRNIFGTGRRFSGRWHRETQTTEEIGLRYREPWLATLPINAEFNFNQRKQDSTYVRSGYGLTTELMATDELDLGIVIAGEGVTPTEGYGTGVASKSRATSIGIALSYDSRNDQLTPTSGLLYRTEYHTGIKKTENRIHPNQQDRSSTQKLSFDIEYVVEPLSRHVIAANLSARDFRSPSVEVSDMFRLGGANTLRGYREGQFLGSRIAWSNLEYRLLVGGRSYVFAFVDAGYSLTLDRPEAGLLREETRKIGYGTGFRVDTPLGLMGVSLAFGEGDTFSTAKLHVRLVSEF